MHSVDYCIIIIIIDVYYRRLNVVFSDGSVCICKRVCSKNIWEYFCYLKIVIKQKTRIINILTVCFSIYLKIRSISMGHKSWDIFFIACYSGGSIHWCNLVLRCCAKQCGDCHCTE